jgi:hypothetical protein
MMQAVKSPWDWVWLWNRLLHNTPFSINYTLNAQCMQLDIRQSGKNDWLIIFLVLDTTELTCYISELIVRLKHVKLRESIKVYFLTDTIQRIENPGDFPQFGLDVSRLMYDNQTGFTQRHKIHISGLDEQDGSAWLKAIRLIYEREPAHFRMFIPWSHATAISILNVNPPTAEYLTDFNLIRNYDKIEKENDNQPLEKATLLRGGMAKINRADINESCLELEHLFISEIATSLKDLVAGDKFDFMVMSNCYTQIIDNCYNLSAITRYYVAPMTLISISAYDFGGLIQHVNSEYTPAIKNEPDKYTSYCKDIIKRLIDGFIAESPGHGKGAVLIANRLDDIRDMVPFLNDLISYLKLNRDETYPVIKDVLKDRTLRFTTKDYVDFIYLFNLIEQQLHSDEFTLKYENLKRLLSNIRVQRHVGSIFHIDRFNYFSIFIPKKPENITELPFLCQYYRGYFRSDFVKDTLWDDFIVDFRKYY